MGHEQGVRTLKKGIVVRSTGSFCTVRFSESDISECRIRGKFRISGVRTTNPIAVGDIVEVEFSEKDATGSICKISERKNYIIRKSTNLSKQSHIIAANIDHAYVITTLAYPRTSTGFIDRFLVTTEAYRIPATVIINKHDLYTDILEEELAERLSIYENAGYRCLVVSAKNGYNMDKLRQYTKNGISLMAGHSGVGKSAIINALNPTLQIKTGEISSVHLKGKHTTTFAEMHELTEGGFIVDTPGIKEFGLIDFEPDELTHFFPEMFKLLPHCRFYNCTHYHEPGCAVIKAVEEGEIHYERYKNYLNILNNVEEEPEEWE